jgi:ABC-type multidrug transport system ATPase subunit
LEIVYTSNFGDMKGFTKSIGLVPQFSSFYPNLTAKANLLYAAKIAGCSAYLSREKGGRGGGGDKCERGK